MGEGEKNKIELEKENRIMELQFMGMGLLNK